jgi:hypothetical protein
MCDRTIFGTQAKLRKAFYSDETLPLADECGPFIWRRRGNAFVFFPLLPYSLILYGQESDEPD